MRERSSTLAKGVSQTSSSVSRSACVRRVSRRRSRGAGRAPPLRARVAAVSLVGVSPGRPHRARGAGRGARRAALEQPPTRVARDAERLGRARVAVALDVREQVAADGVEEFPFHHACPMAVPSRGRSGPCSRLPLECTFGNGGANFPTRAPLLGAQTPASGGRGPAESACWIIPQKQSPAPGTADSGYTGHHDHGLSALGYVD
ncbi:MAG: hypothetical protein F4Y50_13815 [Dehalococcoidia bacterium]|nr:hypothetical protein [Dehalococcoidia bacterium]